MVLRMRENYGRNTGSNSSRSQENLKHCRPVVHEYVEPIPLRQCRGLVRREQALDRDRADRGAVPPPRGEKERGGKKEREKNSVRGCNYACHTERPCLSELFDVPGRLERVDHFPEPAKTDLDGLLEGARGLCECELPERAP